MSAPDGAGRTILITGCSSGIGYYAAHALQKRGWRVFATAPIQADVDRLAGEGLEALRLDYDDTASIAAAVDEVLRRTDGQLYALYNNGAYSQPGALEDLPTDRLRAQFESNVFGWHELTRRVVPVMRRQGKGRIVQCSSVLGFVGVPFLGAYSASKFAVEGLSDVLRLELSGSGIDVALIEPGPIRTKVREKALTHILQTIDVEGSVHAAAYRDALAEMGPGRIRSRFERGPEAVYAKLVHALESDRPKARYRVTVPTHIAAILKRILPTRLLDRLVAR